MMANRFAQDSDYYETVVTIERQETGFGFRIVGGTEEGSQVRIVRKLSHHRGRSYRFIGNLFVFRRYLLGISSKAVQRR